MTPPIFGKIRVPQALAADFSAGQDVEAADWLLLAGHPAYTEEGGEILKGPRNFDAAKRFLRYVGQPITCVAAQDVFAFKVWGELTVTVYAP